MPSPDATQLSIPGLGGYTAAPTLQRLVASYRAPAGLHDELLDAQGEVREPWRPLLDVLASLGPDELTRRFAAADRYLRDAGVFFRVYDDGDGPSERPWPLAHVPLLIDEPEWLALVDGLTQRAELLQKLLADAYGPQQHVRDGSLPALLVGGNAEYLRAMAGVQPVGGRHLWFYAADLARGPDGRWWVLEDRAQAPSGAGYAIENRVAMSRALADVSQGLGVERLAGFFRAFQRTLLQLNAAAQEGRAGRQGGSQVGSQAAADAMLGAPLDHAADAVAHASDQASDQSSDLTGLRVGVLTPGPLNDTYFEHAYLARYLGFLLVEGGDLTVQGDAVYLRTVDGLRRIDTLWRRLDAPFADPLELNPSSQIGVAGLARAVRAGKLAVANALGSGLVEARAMQAFLPGLARKVLGQELKLANIATWWCGQPDERDKVIARLDQMVIAPALTLRWPAELVASLNAVRGGAGLRQAQPERGEAQPERGGAQPERRGGQPEGGSAQPDRGGAELDSHPGALIVADQPILGAELNAAQKSLLVQRLKRRGMDFVGQEEMRLATMPVWQDGSLMPRPYTLRVYLAYTDQGWIAMPGGFCRISDRPDPRAVSMQRGSRSADVWVVGRDHSARAMPARASAGHNAATAADRQAASGADGRPARKATASVASTMLPSEASDVIRRSVGTLPSRAADNLYWMGRYVERGEAILRVLRAYAVRHADVAGGDDPVLRDLQGELIDTGIVAPLTRLSISDGQDTALASLAQVFAAAGHCASRIRDRLSPDAWMALREIEKLLRRPLVRDLDADLIERIQACLRLNSAFAGLTHENMQRSAGWRFLMLGRRIERGQAMARWVRRLGREGAPLGSLEALLELGDCTLNYRQRYTITTGRRSVVDMTLLDANIPRSVAYQAQRIRNLVQGLPGRAMIPLEAQAVVLAETLYRCEPGRIDEAGLLRVEQQLRDLSDAISSVYFSDRRQPGDEAGHDAREGWGDAAFGYDAEPSDDRVLG